MVAGRHGPHLVSQNLDARIAAIRSGATLIALLGNPNVGKSTLFERLTGMAVETAHYPGTTQDILFGESTLEGERLIIVDWPGTYSIDPTVELLACETRPVSTGLALIEPDVVVVVIDATNLARNLALALEVLEEGWPCVVALNLVDEARRQGILLDVEVLRERLGVPVIETVAVTGAGSDILIQAAVEVARARSAHTRVTHVMPRTVEACVQALRARHEEAAALAAAAVRGIEPKGRRRDAWALTTSPLTGTVIAACVLGAIFSFLFVVGERLASLVAGAWASVASPWIGRLIARIAGDGMLSRVLAWGFDAGLEASLTIGLPYILTFYVLLALLEDSGYLNSLAFLADRAMHRMGLHGQAVLPLVAAAGCNVPAVMQVRSLPSRRERFIASVLIPLVPCSARTAVVLGAVGHFIGWTVALGVFAVVFAVDMITGIALSSLAGGRARGLVMEVFPFRRPRFQRVLTKAWERFKEFVFVATPIVVVGSLVLGGAYETGWLWRLTEPLEPLVTGWLGLPAIAGLTLVMGMVRKELSLQLLIALAVATVGTNAADVRTFMTPTNLFVFALVNTIAMPCISTVAVLAREQGWLRTVGIVAYTVVVALFLGGIFSRILPFLGLP